MVPSLVAILFISLLAGVLFIILGFRGKKINDHPVCRWCNFDLDGVYPESITCPECGAGLKREGTVLQGARKRMIPLALLGIFLCITSVIPVGVVAYAALTGSDLNKFKPLSLLFWEARHATQAQSVTIANELMNRAMSRSLDPAQYDSVIEEVLARQADTSLPWAEEWGDLIERAKLDNALKPAQEQRFFNNAGVFVLKTRPNTFPGATLPVVVELKEARVGSNSVINVPISLKSATLGTAELERLANPNQNHDQLSSLMRTSFGNPEPQDEHYIDTVVITGSRAAGMRSDPQAISFQIPADAQAGKQPMKLSLDLRPEESQGFGRIRILGAMGGGFPSPMTTSSTSRKPVKSELSTTIDVRPDSSTLCTAIKPTDTTTAELESHLKPELITLQQNLGFNETTRTLSLTLPTQDSPHPISYRVFARDKDNGDNQVELGTIASGEDPSRRQQTNAFSSFSSSFTISINGKVTTSSSSSDTDSELSAPAPKWLGDKVDIVLKPDPAVAAKTLDQSTYYDKEIIFKDVPVTPSIAPQINDPFGSIFRRVQPQSTPKTAPKRKGTF